MTGAAGGRPAARVNVLRRLAERGLRPDTALGQHFLVDENLADLAIRRAGVTPADVVLEIGAGPGVLTAALARAAATVHAVEIDRRLEDLLDEAISGAGDVRVHWGDAMQMAWEELDPAPTLMVANLPYNIATPAVVESTWRLPSLRAWCVMTQREVADRWEAAPGGRLYGVPSVLLALAAAPSFRRNVGRDVFAPPPRVDSALVAMTRTAPGASEPVRAVVRAAFAQRRKTLVNALGSAGWDKDRVRAACAAAGVDPGARAEHLAPAQFPALAGNL